LKFLANINMANPSLIELDDGKIYRKPLYLMAKTMVSCRFSLKHGESFSNQPASAVATQPGYSIRSCNAAVAAGGWAPPSAWRRGILNLIMTDDVGERYPLVNIQKTMENTIFNG
jgi:hypothetical protein